MPAPNVRLQAVLDGPSPWLELTHLDETTSTNDEVVARTEARGHAGLVVVADRQTAGRGRRGRPWADHGSDRPEAALLVSVSVPAPSEHLTLVPLATGVAVVDALRRTGARASLKWPNDVLLDERKCAGVLTEHHRLPQGAVVAIGVGIDLDWRGLDRPEDTWTSVAEATGDDVDRWDVLADLLRSLEAWLADLSHDPSRLLATYRARCATLGRNVRVEVPGDAVEGRAADIDDDGALLVALPGGRGARITAGDVIHVRPV